MMIRVPCITTWGWAMTSAFVSHLSRFFPRSTYLQRGEKISRQSWGSLVTQSRISQGRFLKGWHSDRVALTRSEPSFRHFDEVGFGCEPVQMLFSFVLPTTSDSFAPSILFLPFFFASATLPRTFWYSDFRLSLFRSLFEYLL